MHSLDNADGTTSYRVRWRQKNPGGTVGQKTQIIETPAAGERFRRNVKKFGPARALEIIGTGDTLGEPRTTLLQACGSITSPT